MKKQNLKLGLNKINVSNLSNVKGGGSVTTYSEAQACFATITAVANVCCDQTLPDTQRECLTVLNGATCGLDCGMKTIIGNVC